MPVAKLKTSSTTDVMKPDEGNDSLEAIIRQAIGKEPDHSFTRASENPAQLFHIVPASDQPEFVGWPLLTQLKVQMQKCDKCSREFCSSINYRRHMHVHHRFRRLDKGSEDEPGVVVLTMAELLSVGMENVKSISVSFYEIVQEHVYDLLDPKRHEVVILEAQGKVQLKGLSQVSSLCSSGL